MMQTSHYTSKASNIYVVLGVSQNTLSVMPFPFPNFLKTIQIHPMYIIIECSIEKDSGEGDYPYSFACYVAKI